MQIIVSKQKNQFHKEKGKIMKKKYDMAAIEILKISAEDVIATSSQNEKPLGQGANHDSDGWT